MLFDVHRGLHLAPVVVFGSLRRTKRLYSNPNIYTRRLIEGIGIFSEEMCSSMGRYKAELTGCIINGVHYGSLIGITKTGISIPEIFCLYQNYPNPFNPVTKIKFDIKAEFRSQESEVKLKIYDITGKEIARLVNEQLQPGSYEVTFDACQPGLGSNLPSGIYFYQLKAGEFIETKNMVLIK